MDKNNQIIKLVQEGMKVEKEGKIDLTQKIFMKAWNAASNDHEKCIAAHFVARNQDNPEETLRWNLEALVRAEKASSEEIKSYYPSLYLCIGISYENLKNYTDAKKYYELAFDKIPDLSKDKENESYNKGVIDNIINRKNNLENKLDPKASAEPSETC